MQTKRRDEIRWFEPDLEIPGHGRNLVRMMIRSPEEAVLSVWVPGRIQGAASLEGTYLLDITRKGLDAPWTPAYFESGVDWWLAGSGTPGRRSPDVREHPVLVTALADARRLLADEEAHVLALGAGRLRLEAGAARGRGAEDRPTIPDLDRDVEHVARQAPKWLSRQEIEALGPRHAAYGFGAAIDTEFGPVTVQIQAGPVVRLDAIVGVPLLKASPDGPIAFHLAARWSQGGGWDEVRPRSEVNMAAAEAILEDVRRLFPVEMRAAFSAWACTTLARAELADAAAVRRAAMSETVAQ
ncbi:hypothetical protein ACFPYM_09655, partial [Methylobacterium hispanicum]